MSYLPHKRVQENIFPVVCCPLLTRDIGSLRDHFFLEPHFHASPTDPLY